MIGNISAHHNNTSLGRTPGGTHAGPRVLLHTAAVLSMAGPRKIATGQRHQRTAVPMNSTASRPVAGLRQGKGAAPAHRSRLGQSLAAQHPWHEQTRKQQAVSRHDGGSAPSRTPGRNLHQSDSRDSFKQEAWFISHGGQLKRVTKHQARKQGWSGPAAMQAAQQARLEARSSKAPVPNPDRDQRVLPDAVGAEPASRQSEARVQKRSAVNEDSEAGKPLTVSALQTRREREVDSEYDDARAFEDEYLPVCKAEADARNYPFENSYVLGLYNRTSSVLNYHRNWTTVHSYVSVSGGCVFQDGWKYDSDTCYYYGAVFCPASGCSQILRGKSDARSLDDCIGSTNITLDQNIFMPASCTLGLTPKPTEETSAPAEEPGDIVKRTSSTSSSGPDAGLVAVSAALGTAFLTLGFLGGTGKRRPDH